MGRNLLPLALLMFRDPVYCFYRINPEQSGYPYCITRISGVILKIVMTGLDNSTYQPLKISKIYFMLKTNEENGTAGYDVRVRNKQLRSICLQILKKSDCFYF